MPLYNDKIQERMEREKDSISEMYARHHLNKDKVTTPKVFPYDPYIKLQNVGVSTVRKEELIDVSSDILNINRNLSNNPLEQWIPGRQGSRDFIHLRDGLFQTESTLLNNPPIELRGQTKNRWIDLPINPQDNSIEPFVREGENTHLSLIDNYKC